MIKITKPLKQYTFNQILHNCNSRKHFRHSTHNKQALFSCYERQRGDTIKCVRKSGTQDFKQFLPLSLSLPPLTPPPLPTFFRVAHIICFLFHCSWQKENLVIEWYRTCALPARRWQMDYKNFKGEHLEHQGRDARYLNYHSLPRRQWLPDTVHTSRNSAPAQT